MLSRIRLIATDVDGVLTDGTFWFSTSGDEMKRFCFRDVTGIALAKSSGLIMALISGESSPAGKALVQRYAEKMKIEDVYKGCQDKSVAVRELASKYGLSLGEICFIGDDFNDVSAMALVGLSVAPADAHDSARKAATLITKQSGGQGVVREVIDMVMRSRAESEEVLPLEADLG